MHRLLEILALLSVAVLQVYGDNVNYGDSIFLQNNNGNKLWLSGSRMRGNKDVRTSDYYANTSKGIQLSYQWVVRSKGDTSRKTIKRSDNDPEKGQCVRFGDKIYLQNKYMDKRWLTGSRGVKGKGNTGVRTDSLKTTTAPTTYRWIIRSSVVYGTRSQPDPGVGHCVSATDVIYLQNDYENGRWLSGGGKYGTVTKNEAGEQNLKETYKWTIRKVSEGPGDGYNKDKNTCYPLGIKGSWVSVGVSNAASHTIEYMVSVTNTAEESEEEIRSQNYENEVAVDVSAGIEYGSAEYNTNVHLSSKISKGLQNNIRKAFKSSRTESMKQTMVFKKSGTVWQFVYNVKTSCKENEVRIEVRDLLLSNEIPCCPPGFNNLTTPHGPCRERSVCSCPDSVCDKKEPVKKVF